MIKYYKTLCCDASIVINGKMDYTCAECGRAVAHEVLRFIRYEIVGNLLSAKEHKECQSIKS